MCCGEKEACVQLSSSNAKPMSAKSKKNVQKTRPLENLPKNSLPTADKNYRENPDRSVNVFGEVNASLIRQLTPHILKLRKECSEPITVYIDSPGGAIASYEHLEGLLFNPDQNGNKCRIITVATSYAASAAARLLSKGDYSMAYKNATIHCHGARYEGGTVTKERAESMAESLSIFNLEMASDFAHKIIESLTWLYHFNKEEVLERHKVSNSEAFHPMFRLSQIIGSKLVGLNRHLLNIVLDELNTVADLEIFLGSKKRAKQLEDAQKRGQAHRDFRLLRLIGEYLEAKLSGEEKKSGLTRQTVSELIALHSLRRSYYEKFLNDCDDPEPLLMMFCEKDDLKSVEALSDGERRTFLLKQCGLHLFAAWQLASTVAANLVKGENSLSASEAYWMGLVDEVVGDGFLICRRHFHESIKDG
jgi:ATP-dependent protease ClpP protease subunit